MLASVRDANASGAARRRQRRLRQWLRHERLSVAMVLAECTHHSAPRGQKMARAGGRARDELHGHAPDDAPPQGRILRHVVGHLPAPSLDVPVPQMVDQPVDFLTFFAMLLPAVDEQVVAVPKFIQEVTPQRLRPSGASAAGGTAGGSTYDRVIFLVAADYGSDRGHSSSSWTWSSWRSARFFPRTEFNSCCRR